MFTAKSPIYSRPRFLPPSRLDSASIQNSLIADGCIIQKDARIENSVIGLRCRIGRGVTIRNSVIMGADYYEESSERDHAKGGDFLPLGIGDGATIETAIIDKNCRIGPQAKISNCKQIQESTDEQFLEIHDGIIVVEKDATIPAHWQS